MTNRIALNNIDVITLDDEGTIHRNVTLLVENGIITEIGGTADDQLMNTAVDCTDKVAMPGLVNSHCHSPMNMVRGWAEDLPFVEWLEAIWVAESGITPDDVYWAAALAAAEMIRSGTVAYNDKYFYMGRVADVVQESGLRAALTWTVFGMGEDTEVGSGLDETISWIKELDETSQGRIKTYIGPHSPYLCPENFLRKTVDIAHELGKGIHLHVAETQEQVDQSIARYNLRPVQHLDSLGIFDLPDNTIAAHTLHVDDKDIEILVNKNVIVPHCPITYMKLAMPFPSIKKCVDAGVQISLGTDGPGSNADMDMFAVIRQTALIHKYQAIDPAMISGDTALRMATQTGAKAVGMPGHGILQIGAAADLILIDMNAPHLRPVHNIIANLVHCVKGSDVCDVMVDGNWLMRNRELMTLDEEQILYEAEKRAHDIVYRGQKQLRQYVRN
jgi:5-methylthioadenosine/S-adenosylhomocysteine deaminase